MFLSLISHALALQLPRTAPIWALSPYTPRAALMDWMACDSMPSPPRKLPMQDLARTIKYWSAAISHVHWSRQFKLFWSRQYMSPRLG